MLLPGKMQECIPRITRRGWRANIIVAIGFISILGFLVLMLSLESVILSDGVRVAYRTQYVYDMNVTEEETLPKSALQQVLEVIVAEPAAEFRPDGKDTRDKDLSHIARYTAVLKDLLRIHDQISPTAKGQEHEKVAFRETIDAVQGILYPWITQPDDNGNQYFASFFELLDSYTEEAGIVISTGVNGGFRWTVHQIVTLRAILNCTLPIEIFYGGDEDLPAEYRTFLQDIESAFPDSGSIRTVDLTQIFPDPDNLLGFRDGGWAMRPFGILASSFKKVILTDADTVFLQDPRVILEEEMFREYGSVFWHDRELNAASDETYQWADELLEAAKADSENLHPDGWFSKTTFYEMESGAVVIDKSRNLAGVLLACHLNTQSVRNEITYQKFYGDKESYWFAHALTSTSYHFVPLYSGGIGPISRHHDNEEICTLQLLHMLESTGEPLWFNNGLAEFKGAGNDGFLRIEGWVPQGGRWRYSEDKRLPNLFCVEMPVGEAEGLVGKSESVNRVEGELGGRIEGMIDVARRYDGMMEEAGLVSIRHS